MKVLGIDTGAAAGSAAIMQDDVLVSEVLLTSRRTHSGRIMKAIDMVLSMAELKPSDLDGFAVAIGPGSFTGLRIGISTVKGLAFSAEKPVASVTTLDALAGQFPCSHALICPILNAGKGDVYTASY
ncbi:MAG: tRNA (adenosine(37)-N6)-threonylcarbamoyltransferase complex dimerization subunit type 1 TsaB, partial [Desulfobacterales bacterium]|nr:tRNA (adenosine(37)-N6)-threonylcarbamoyltransferase complex dimerization subunit type 1 TsaB [Desulfobacterales bacterium]